MKDKITIKDILKKRLVDSPNRVFIKNIGEEFSWLDIEKASQIIAKDLYDLGVRDGTHVGLASTNSINWIFTFFALSKLNANIILLNPILNPRELSIFSNIADIEILCYGSSENQEKKSFFEDLKNDDKNKIRKIYSITNEIDYRKRFDEYNAIASIYKNNNSNESKIFLFTSGSTGVPKAVVRNSSDVVYMTLRHIDCYHLNENNIHCMILPLFHIFALYTVFLASAISNSKIIMPKDNHSSTILKTIYEEKCTNFNAVPTILLALISNKEFKKEDLSTIRLSIVGGAASSPKHLEKLCEIMPNNTIINGYGLTESTPGTYLIYKAKMDSDIVKTVGKPYEGVDIEIYNQKTNTFCKRGEIGEIVIKGFGNMMYYYKLPKEEQAIDNNGWLHTGDLGYITSEGYLCISGRLKEIIIRGGENIMPLEISSIIEKGENIKEVKVIGVPDNFRGEEIAACIVLKEGCHFNEKETRDMMSKYLSKHKIPKYFIIYDSLPKLSTGKIDVVTLKNETIKKICS